VRGAQPEPLFPRGKEEEEKEAGRRSRTPQGINPDPKSRHPGRERKCFFLLPGL
jgi:hypothetical protein